MDLGPELFVQLLQKAFGRIPVADAIEIEQFVPQPGGQVPHGAGLGGTGEREKLPEIDERFSNGFGPVENVPVLGALRRQCRRGGYCRLDFDPRHGPLFHQAAYRGLKFGFGRREQPQNRELASQFFFGAPGQRKGESRIELVRLAFAAAIVGIAGRRLGSRC